MDREVILPSSLWVRKPEDLPRDSVPIDTSKLDRKMVCISYPGIVNNLSKALDTLGGLDDINTRYSDSNQRLELRWRPEDPYCKSSYGDSSATNNLLLRFKKRKRKRADGTIEYEHKVEIIGTVKVTYRFQGMVDFQYLPMVAKPSSPGSQDKEYMSIFEKLIVRNPGDIKDWLQNDVPLFLPPIIFSRMDMPMEYLYRSEMQHRAGFVNPQDLRPSHLIGTARQRRSHHTIFVNFEDKIIPEGPMPGAEVALRPKVKTTEVEEKLRALFQQKPIWSRNGLCCKIGSRRDNLRYILPLIAYYFITGPWRSLWVRFGYDPRKDPAAKKYQIVDFRVRQRSGNDIINIKAKRSTFSYKLPTVVSKQTSQVAMINRLELAPSRETQEVPPSSKSNLESTYIFRANVLPPFRQMFYQICDIEDIDVQSLLIQNDGQEVVCDEKDGWCIKDMNDKCREIMYHKLSHFTPIKDILVKRKKCMKNKSFVYDDSSHVSSDEESESDQTEEESFNEMETEMLDCV